MHFSTAFIAATGLAAAGIAVGQTNSFSVNTPSSLVECQPFQITWTGGQAPYFPRITAAGQVDQILEQLPQTSSTNTVWTVDQPVGTKVTIVIGDSNGATAPSGQSPAIAAGSSSDCSNSSSGGSSASGSSSADSSSTSSGSSPSSSSSGSSDGAVSLHGFSAVIAGIVGIGAAALA